MMNENQAGASSESLTHRFRRATLVELPCWQLLILAAVVGITWAASLFDWSFVTGRDAFWLFPHGMVPGGETDTAAPFAAYLYYVQNPWYLPLFYVPILGWPAGVNLIFADFVPIVALTGKLIHSSTGAVINLYGPYLFLCFVFPGVMMALVLVAAKIRYALAAIIAAILADTAPILLWRWGHVALMAQFLPIGALALYLFSLQMRPWRGLATIWIAYLILAYLTNIYLFAMVGTVWLCAIIQRRLDGFDTTWEALGIGALTIFVVTIVIALGGQFSPGTPLPFDSSYGHFSMNLASPFIPQSSGVFPWGRKVIDATNGQYEGFNYFGLGLLLASLLVVPAQVSWLRRNLKWHVALLSALVALTAFAISNRAYFGHRLLLDLSLPDFVIQILGIFRSSGRLFWLICYSQLAVVMVLGFRHVRPLISVCMVGAVIVQLFDVQPLRRQLIATIAEGPGIEELDPAQVAQLTARARRIDIVPSFECIPWQSEDKQPTKLARANVELMLSAARINVATNTVDLSRHTYNLTWLDLLREPSRGREVLLEEQHQRYCKQEIERARTTEHPGDIFVLLSDQPRPAEMLPGVICSPLSWARYCQRP